MDNRITKKLDSDLIVYFYRYGKLFLFFFILISPTCKEAYYPKIDDTEKLLVVEGYLTDESNEITVKLSRTIPFQAKENDPEIGATVTVSDYSGKNIVFIERPPGTYKSKTFTYQYGKTYVLNIITKNNKKYKSSPQTLYDKSDLEPVSSVLKNKLFQTTFENDVTSRNYDGLEFSTNIKAKSVDSPFFRFSNEVLVEYTEKINWIGNFDSMPGYYHCWKKYYPNESFNLNDTEFNNLDDHLHTLAFCPIDTSYFVIIQKEIGVPVVLYFIVRDLYYFAITVKKYHINEDVHKYYKAINAQIEAKNRIFDPISFQVRGNISCVDNPEEPVLGVFEVSSVSKRTYSFSDFLPDKTVKYEEVEPIDLESISLVGSVYNNYPPFWIYNY